MTGAEYARLRPQFAPAADRILRDAAQRERGVPGVVAAVTGRLATLYEGTAGVRELAAPQPMTVDSVFYLFSCTKAITAVSVMQLVEAGLLDLADPAERYVAELGDVRVLRGFDADGEPLLRAPKSALTVGQLLLHTAGFGYEFFNADLLRYSRTAHARAIPNETIPSARSVLTFDPGTRWEYGSSIDWAGKVVEAIRGRRLGDIMRDGVFEPLAMHDTGFALTPSMEARRAVVHKRGRDGELTPDARLGVPDETQADMGGSGLYATPGDYLKFIRMILNEGRAPDGRRILEPATVARMLSNGLGSLHVRPLPGVIAQLANDAEFFPGMPKSWGLSWMINDEDAPTGRPAGCVAWGGLANLFYWIDQHNGIGGFWGTQILPFIDGVSLPGFLAFETAVYEHLTAARARTDG